MLSVCGAPTYQLIRNLVAPQKPTEKSFTEIVKLMSDHYQPKPSPIVQCFLFNTRSRKQGESVATFVAELKKLSEHCDYGDSLNDMIRDRLVCGINDGRIQRRLLAEAELTYKKAFELAQAMETAERNAQDLQGPKAERLHAVIKPRNVSDSAKRGEVHPMCYRCGGKHKAPDCRVKEMKCHQCGKKGHLAKVCRSKRRTEKRQSGQRRTHQLQDEVTATSDDAAYALYYAPSDGSPPLMVTMDISHAKLQMEVDTGAMKSVISDRTYRRLWSKDRAPPLQPTDAKLKTYTGERINVLGAITVDVTCNGQQARLSLLVVAGNGPSLMGQDWLQAIRLDWAHLHQVRSTSKLQGVLDAHSQVFDDKLGKVQGVAAKLHIEPNIQPIFCRLRTVPYALRSKVEAELDRLEKEGVIEPVQFSDWAAPIVPVVKKDSSIRICGDYKLTVNRAAKMDTYPLPRIDDLFASLAGGKTFSTLDLAHAYQQVPLEEGSRQYVTINTTKGLYRYNRLPFGVASAPSIFQRIMDAILQGLPGVCVYLDDILVTGETEDKHLQNLEQVLSRLEKAGLQLQRQKCTFMQPSVEYLGHRISAAGLHPSEEKVRAIVDAPVPKDVTQLRSFLGLVNYYGKFLPQLSSTLALLYALLQKKARWTWGAVQDKAFLEAKGQLTSPCLLVHFDPRKELVLSCDASPYGVGAVLSHREEDGSDRPVAYASRSLTPAERKYAQLEKEGLAIVFRVKKFHQYLLGRKFTILSDHKPLRHLFSESRPIPPMASARIQRWALTLSAYDYGIEYRPGDKHSNTDVLSRLPLPESVRETPQPGEMVLLMESLQSSPVNANQIKRWTDHDPILSKVRDFTLQGWQHSSDEQLQPYQRRHEELSVEDGCVLWGTRVVVPPAGRARVVEELHEGHPGVSCMKSLARSFVWWPGMDHDLEAKVKSCQQCQVTRHSPPPAPLHPWEWPQRPWVRIHVDYAGPFLGKMFLVVIDSHSKWMEVEAVSAATSAITIEKLRAMFAIHGLPEMLVSDNGSCFTSAEFQQFTRNGIRHVKVAPYHPASNGLAERAVQTFKEGMKKIKTSVDYHDFCFTTKLLHTPLLGYLPQSCSWVDIFVLILTCYALMLLAEFMQNSKNRKWDMTKSPSRDSFMWVIMFSFVTFHQDRNGCQAAS